MAMVFVAVQLFMTIEYITVLLPMDASEGVNTPVDETAGLPLQLPPGGLAVKFTGEKDVHKGPIGFKVGVSGLTTVAANVCCTGQ